MRIKILLVGLLAVSVSAFAEIETNRSIQNIAIECRLNDQHTFSLDTFRGVLSQSSTHNYDPNVEYVRIQEKLPKDGPDGPVEYLQLNHLLEKAPSQEGPVEYVKISYNEKFSFPPSDEHGSPLHKCQLEWSKKTPIGLTCELYNLKWHYDGKIANVPKLKLAMGIAEWNSDLNQFTTGKILYPQGTSTDFYLPFYITLPLKYDGKTTLVKTDNSCTFKVAYSR